MHSILINLINKKLSITLLLILLGIINPWNKALAVSHDVALFTTTSQEIKIMPNSLLFLIKNYSNLSFNPWGHTESSSSNDSIENQTEAKMENNANTENLKQSTQTNQSWSIKNNLCNTKFLVASFFSMLAVGYCANSTSNTLNPYNSTTGMLDLNHPYNNGTNITDMDPYNNEPNITDMKSPFLGKIMKGSITWTQVQQDRELSLKTAKRDLDFILKKHDYKKKTLTYGCSTSYKVSGKTTKKLNIKMTYSYDSCKIPSNFKAEYMMAEGHSIEKMTYSPNPHLSLTYIMVNGKSYIIPKDNNLCENNPCDHENNDYYSKLKTTQFAGQIKNEMIVKTCPPVRDIKTPYTVIAIPSMKAPANCTKTLFRSSTKGGCTSTVCKNAKIYKPTMYKYTENFTCFHCGKDTLKSLGIITIPREDDTNHKTEKFVYHYLPSGCKGIFSDRRSLYQTRSYDEKLQLHVNIVNINHHCNGTYEWPDVATTQLEPSDSDNDEDDCEAYLGSDHMEFFYKILIVTGGLSFVVGSLCTGTLCLCCHSKKLCPCSKSEYQGVSSH